jgi:hypothetical protein
MSARGQQRHFGQRGLRPVLWTSRLYGVEKQKPGSNGTMSVAKRSC